MGYNLLEMHKIPTSKNSRNLNDKSMRESLRFWTTGVTIVSVAHMGIQHGMTVNSFTSLSLEPPLVLVSLEKGTRTHDLVVEAGVFAVTLLSQSQELLSDRFAGKDSEKSDRFADIEILTLESGNPVLSDGLAFFDCQVQASHSAGSHSLFIAEVLSTGHLNGTSSSEPPLVYHNRSYRQLRDH